MFERARRRLTGLYIGLFALVLGIFSLVFYLTMRNILAPGFDIGSEVTNQQAAQLAYQAAVRQIGFALLIGFMTALLLVSAAAWMLAARTLDPIREAHVRQRRFIADASHEIRSPIAAIRSSAEVALDPSTSEPALRQALGTVLAASERLTNVTADLLILAQAGDTTIKPRLEPVDLAVVAAETVDAELLGRGESSKRPALELAADVVVRADPDELGRAARNLIDNAFRYGANSVRVRVRGTDREAVLEVADDGPGIAATDVERVFEPFYRVRSDASAPPGSGLGLAIAASLARRNGGRIVAESRPGQGSVFRVVLPRFR